MRTRGKRGKSGTGAVAMIEAMIDPRGERRAGEVATMIEASGGERGGGTGAAWRHRRRSCRGAAVMATAAL
jgi:hypothetical protein